MDEKPPKLFDGKKLRALRDKARLTRFALARLTDFAVSQESIVRYERDGVIPSFDAAYRLARALGIGVEGFINGDDR